MKFMKWTKIKFITTGVVAALLAAGIGTYIWKTLNEPEAKSDASAPGPSDRNPNTGPIGSLADEQMAQVKTIKAALEKL